MGGRLPKAIIFDFDGTIVDSAPVVCGILNEMREERNLDPMPFELLKSYLSLGGDDMVGYALEMPNNESAFFVNEFRRRYFQRPSGDILYPAIVELLAVLRSAGVFLCICTNKPRKLVEKILNELGLRDQFDFINAGGDFPNKKPHVSNVRACLDFVRADGNDVVFVGDSMVDQASAASAGVLFYLYLSGYGGGVDKDKADFAFQNYSELISHLCL